MRNTDFDFDIHRRGLECIAQGGLTNSKRPECLLLGLYPTHARGAKGAKLIGTNGKEYIDFICGLGSNLFGYGHPDIANCISRAALDGINYSISSVSEVEAAETLKSIFKWPDRVKFLKTGTEACMASIRIARAYTNRPYVLSEGYHGWESEFVSMTPPHYGVIPNGFIKNLNTYRIGDDLSRVAAIILEPVMLDRSRERIDWLRELRRECTKYGTLLIFDEIITGFRWPQFSVSNFYGIKPDILCLGKAIAGGMPLSAVLGTKEVMECKEYFVSSTFAGERLSLECLKLSIDLLKNKLSVKDLWQKSDEFLREFNSLTDKFQIEGYPTRGYFKGDEKAISLFWSECANAGILFGPSYFVNFCHMDLFDDVMYVIRDVMYKLNNNMIKDYGVRPVKPFAAKARE